MDVCVSDASCLRVLSRAVIAAARIAEHVQLSAQSGSLHLRVLTPTYSTYALFRLHASFFSSATLPTSSSSAVVSTRLLLPLLRVSQGIASLRLYLTETHLRLTLLTQASLTKRFQLPLLNDRVPAIRLGTTPPHTLSAAPSFFSDLLTNFHAKLDEISLIPASQAITLSSFVDDLSNPANAFLRTEISVDPSQFNLRHNTHPPQQQTPTLTFLCRPFRAVLDFCDAVDIPITLAYHLPGSPLVLNAAPNVTTNHPQFDAVFVFATRTAPNDNNSNTPTPLHQQHHHPSPQATTRPASASTRSHQQIRPLHPQPQIDNPPPQHVSESLDDAQQLLAHSSLSPPRPPASPAPPHADADDDADEDDEDDFVEGTPPP